MIRVDEQLIKKLPAIRQTNLEAQIVTLIGERLGVPPAEALRIYYSSELADKIESNLYGLQYLDARYLVDEILK